MTPRENPSPVYQFSSELLPERPLGEPSMWRYLPLLPLDGEIEYSLPVGGTPTIEARRLRAEIGLRHLWLKDEGRGPSGSNKDRATALLIELGRRSGMRTITTASTGNAALATCVGAAAAGMRAVIFIPPECERDKAFAMKTLGADVFVVEEGYAAAVRLSRSAAAHFGWVDRNTGVNPLTLEAKKTVAFELWEQIGIPDLVVVPVGDGATLVALDKGFNELINCGVPGRVPMLVGVQASACDPLARRWRQESCKEVALMPEETIARGIAVAEPLLGDEALEAVTRTAGQIVSVTDSEIVAATSLLAVSTGMLVDPAAAASIAGLRQLCQAGQVDTASNVVALITARARSYPMPSTDAPLGRIAVATLDELARRLVVS